MVDKKIQGYEFEIKQLEDEICEESKGKEPTEERTKAEERMSSVMTDIAENQVTLEAFYRSDPKMIEDLKASVK